MGVTFTADLITALVAGLAGSLHCIGMCGPLATVGCRAGFAAAPLRSRGGFRAGNLISPALFVAGKFLSYSLFGLLAGLLGAALIGSGLLGRTTGILSIAGGVLMIILIAVSRVGSWTGRTASLSVYIARVALKFGTKAPLLLGVAAALLPCGLLYAMVARSAAAGEAVQGMALMQAFGLGTTPALLGLGMIVRWIPQKWNCFGSVLGEIILIITAAILIWRGFAGLSAPTTPSCCP